MQLIGKLEIVVGVISHLLGDSLLLGFVAVVLGSFSDSADQKKSNSKCIMKKHCFEVEGTRHENDERCCFCGFRREQSGLNKPFQGLDTDAFLDFYDRLSGSSENA
jgi:hypothetical protein